MRHPQKSRTVLGKHDLDQQMHSFSVLIKLCERGKQRSRPGRKTQMVCQENSTARRERSLQVSLCAVAIPVFAALYVCASP